MTPTTWIGLTGLCAVAGLLITAFTKSAGAGAYFGRLTEAMERIDKSLVRIAQQLEAHGTKIDQHNERLAWLEFCLNKDDQATSVVADVMRINERRKRRGGDT